MEVVSDGHPDRRLLTDALGKANYDGADCRVKIQAGCLGLPAGDSKDTGGILRVDDAYIDASVRNRLNRFRKEFSLAGYTKE